MVPFLIDSYSIRFERTMCDEPACHLTIHAKAAPQAIIPNLPSPVPGS
jgi:hypothetical protein